MPYPTDASISIDTNVEDAPLVKADVPAVDSSTSLSEMHLTTLILAGTVVAVVILFAVLIVVAWWLKKGTSKYRLYCLCAA